MSLFYNLKIHILWPWLFHTKKLMDFYNKNDRQKMGEICLIKARWIKITKFYFKIKGTTLILRNKHE